MSAPDGDCEALLALAQSVVDRAAPGEQLECIVSRRRGTSVKAYDGEVESFSSAESFGLGIRVIRDHRQGFAHAGSHADDVVADTLAEARDNVAFGEPDEWNGLAEPDGVPVVEQDLWDPTLLDLGPEAKVDLALELERRVTGLDPRVRSVRSAGYADGAGAAAVASTAGVAVAGRSTSCSVSASALARDGDETQIGGAVDVGRAPGDLDLGEVAADAVDRATRMLGASPTASQRLTVVFDPRTAATLLAIAGGNLTGERVLKGRSPFADRLGDAIASPVLTLVDDPTDARSLAADSHDGEGLACRRNPLVVDGVLDRFLHNSYSGRRAGAASTGSAVRGARTIPGVGCQALSVVPGDRAPDELVAGIDRGILVQSLSGVHSGVNAVSGDFSVGAEGLLIRDGALAEPVREVTLGATLQRLLLGVEAVGSDLEWLPGGTGSATLVIADVSLGGR
ncbi:MAG: TldD/PmbA family protein [Acidimicrobiales bacterium]|nr:TldD/PmbA family protein [Acidimicrobiales bacterium]